jgi:ribose 5-phosphate isomerase B
MPDRRDLSPDDLRDVVRRVVEAALAGRLPGIPAGTGLAVDLPATPSAGTPAAGIPSPPAAAGAAPAGTATAIALGADHSGWELKDRIAAILTEAGFAVHDCGTSGPEAVDYPDLAHPVARLVADGTCRWGIVLDGAGIGSAIVANKVPGIRAANCHDLSSARNSREHNHANVLTLGARFVGEGLAIEIVRAWLGTGWVPGRHAARVAKISQIERRYANPAGDGGPL